MHEPNLTFDLTLGEFEKIKLEKLIAKKLSNNNQGVERLVKQFFKAYEYVGEGEMGISEPQVKADPRCKMHNHFE